MKRISILLLILLICLVMAAWPQAQPQWWQQKIITFDAPGAGTGAGQGTQPNAVNSAGVVAGWYLDDNNVWYGFLRTPDGKIITFSAPGAGTGTYQGSGGWGITPAGDIGHEQLSPLLDVPICLIGMHVVQRFREQEVRILCINKWIVGS